ncbi:PAS domain-containing protein [Legionella sp. km772]|uniref:PAS domain-containing protein n=1 Tax=Legionella sp. km772 TaxID=2498111 RepID=UPI000F8E9284|nr:PAS domain-containing protein [Legionella sp. km772]RUR04725.1 PAS domain-containing protein [Legionella sp. km772]
MKGISDFAYEALHSANDGITIVDMKQKHQPLVFINPSFEQLTGYSAHEIIGKNCRFLQGSLPPQPETHLIRQALNEQKNCRVILRNMKRDGSLFWNELSLAPIKENNHLSYYIGIQKDVTEEIIQNQTIIQVLEQNKIAAMREAISNFADQVSQPLTAISIYSKACSLIMEKVEDGTFEFSRMHQGLENIKAQTLIANEITRTLNDNFNDLNFFIEQLNANELIIQLINIIKYTCPYPIHLNLAPRLPEIKINREHLAQILLNLLRNSVEAFQRCGMDGQITLSSRHQANSIILEIIDTGPGLPDDFINNGPVPFFTSKTSGIGTGLGICRKLIELYEGHISFNNDEVGLKVSIHFPL